MVWTPVIIVSSSFGVDAAAAELAVHSTPTLMLRKINDAHATAPDFAEDFLGADLTWRISGGGHDDIGTKCPSGINLAIAVMSGPVDSPGDCAH